MPSLSRLEVSPRFRGGSRGRARLDLPKARSVCGRINSGFSEPGGPVLYHEECACGGRNRRRAREQLFRGTVIPAQVSTGEAQNCVNQLRQINRLWQVHLIARRE